MWKARNSAKFAKTNPKQTWERRAFEDAIRCWKSEAERKGREIVVGAEDFMRASVEREEAEMGAQSPQTANGYHGILGTNPGEHD